MKGRCEGPDWPALLDWLQTLSTQSLQEIRRYYAEQAHFKDPFNDCHGVDEIEALFAAMFTHLQQPKFTVLQALRDGDQAFITWDFDFIYSGRALRIHGASHLQFDTQGRIILHRDYWDAAEALFAKIPVIGGMITWLRKKMRHG